MSNFAIIETILRDRYVFFAEIRDDIDVPNKIRFMFISCAGFFALYGAVMGASHGIVQVACSAVKLPLLFLATLVICAPSLHFFNILFGSRQSISQSLALILTAITTTAVLLMSLAPITLFFLLSTSEYDFFKLLNVVFFVVAAGLGLLFLRQGIRYVTEKSEKVGLGARRLIFYLWVVLYAFVGTQMAWTLSPFIGDPGKPFILFTEPGSNFYANVIASIGHLFG